ncbi:CHY zinc finger protein [Sediminibacillus albus]|uniref:Uncharacterized protein, contains Zn-finger domain of CHY type n=1 Tax=Sediminibacillus albus TaxID=407036 RepID=A0A1G8VVU4_9BACI|nr:CHY zinc finger protein [Sediminibacillus albus]SDJ69615.1 Uncharacterized protein, contains Zn-finger domain of CHY type [Sediminibacillus albus]
MEVGNHQIFGKVIDSHTRCRHYHSSQDIIAIKFACCKQYYPCYKCHQESTGHSAEVWEKTEFNERAVLCGACHYELTITEYLYTDCCPSCKSPFNPGCKIHHHLYFGR